MVLVLRGVAVPGHEVGLLLDGLVEVEHVRRLPAVAREVPLAETRTTLLSTFGMPPFGSTMIAPYMPFAMCASTGAVPQWYMKAPGVLRAEAEVHRLLRIDGRERDVRRDVGGVEVDRVRDRAAVDERDVDHLALRHVHHGSGSGAVERPARVVDARSDVEHAILQRDREVPHRCRRRRRQRGRVRLVRRCKRGGVFGKCDRSGQRPPWCRGSHAGHRCHRGRACGGMGLVAAAHDDEPEDERDDHRDAGEGDGESHGPATHASGTSFGLTGVLMAILSADAHLLWCIDRLNVYVIGTQ